MDVRGYIGDDAGRADLWDEPAKAGLGAGLR
jgi:hypothetical protein